MDYLQSDSSFFLTFNTNHQNISRVVNFKALKVLDEIFSFSKTKSLKSFSANLDISFKNNKEFAYEFFKHKERILIINKFSDYIRVLLELLQDQNYHFSSDNSKEVNFIIYLKKKWVLFFILIKNNIFYF